MTCTSAYVGAGLPCAASFALSISRAARSAWSSRSCRVQRGQSGSENDSSNSEYGTTIAWPHATWLRLFQRTSRAT